MAARHLWQFGYRPTCLYPKPTQRQLFTNLVEQCKQLDIEFLPSWAAAGDLGACDKNTTYLSFIISPFEP